MQHPLNLRREDRRLRRDPAFLRRRLTAPWRAMPDFFVVGAMKAGSSSLFHYLQQHPLIARPKRKELHYFSHGRNLGKTDGWYRAHFPLRARMADGAITGEGTPDYMYDPDVPAQLAARVPHARLIALLRDPVNRAVSHYHHEVRMGREYLPIEEAMAVEEERLASAQAAGPAACETWMHACYKRRGHYAEQIERLRGAFPPERLLILDSGTLFRDPGQVMAQALDFLGLPSRDVAFDFPVKNSGGERPEIPDRLRADLEAYFAPHNDRLARLLGRRPDW